MTNTYIPVDTSVPAKPRPMFGEIAVNGVVIPEHDILAEVQHHPADKRQQALNEAIRALVVRELLLQEARRLSIAGVPERDGNGRMETVEDAAVRVLIEREVAVPDASADECRRFYENNPDRFMSETIHEACHILFVAPVDDAAARAQAKADAQAILRHLTEHPDDFREMAKMHSACPSREHGGNLGQLIRGSTVAEFEAALAKMEPGELRGEPLATRFGFHVVRLDRKIAGERLPFEFVQSRIEGWLQAASWSRAVSQYVGILAGRAEIKGIDLNGADGPLVQ